MLPDTVQCHMYPVSQVMGLALTIQPESVEALEYRKINTTCSGLIPSTWADWIDPTKVRLVESVAKTFSSGKIDLLTSPFRDKRSVDEFKAVLSWWEQELNASGLTVNSVLVEDEDLTKETGNKQELMERHSLARSVISEVFGSEMLQIHYRDRPGGPLYYQEEPRQILNGICQMVWDVEHTAHRVQEILLESKQLSLPFSLTVSLVGGYKADGSGFAPHMEIPPMALQTFGALIHRMIQTGKLTHLIWYRGPFESPNIRIKWMKAYGHFLEGYEQSVKGAQEPVIEQSTQVDPSIWVNTVMASMTGGKFAKSAMEEADIVMEEYAKRFNQENQTWTA